MPTPVDVDRSATVLTELAIDIDAPREVLWRLHTEINAWPKWQHDISDARLEEPLARGASFHWAIHGMGITSTVYAIDEGSRILWGGDANGITGIHEWTFTDTPRSFSTKLWSRGCSSSRRPPKLGEGRRTSELVALVRECNSLAAQSSSTSLPGSTANGIQFTLGEEQRRA